MSVYNVEEFIDEAVESILNQDIGFEENVQIVFVDDGTEDRSGEICERYAKKFPKNIVVAHKKNGGLASAKNFGIRFAKGKYINYFDPDDILSPNTLSKVWGFFEQHEQEIDIVCIPLVLFGTQNGPHYLNYKFNRGSRVIDLKEEYQNVLLSSASSFFHARNKCRLKFDETLRTSEDFKLISYLLLDKQKLGVVSDVTYHYRKRFAGTSLIQTAEQNENWYFEILENFMLPLFDYAKKKLKEVPKFIQYAVLSDLKWKLNQPQSRNILLKDPEKLKKYKELLYLCYKSCSVEVINSIKTYNGFDKAFVYSQIMKKKIQTRVCETVDDECFLCEGKKIFYLSKSSIHLCFFEVEGDKVNINFAFDHMPFMKDIEVMVKINGKLKKPSKTGRKIFKYKIDDLFYTQTYYSITIPITNKDTYFSFYLVDKKNKKHIINLNHKYEKFFPINNTKGSYFVFKKHLFKAINDRTFVIKKTNVFRNIWNEFRYDRNLLKIKNENGKKLVLIRWYYKLFKLFNKKKRWIITDRINKAGDNGESFFRFLCDTNFKKTKFSFVIAECEDKKYLLKEYRNIVGLGTKKHYKEYLLADDIISSHVDDYVINPLDRKHEYLKDIIYYKNFIFLQHGVTKDDLSNWLNKYNKNIKGFITSARMETQSMLGYDYFYKQDEIWETGFARFDRLYQNEKKCITIMPTWRRYLAVDYNHQTGVWELLPNFKESKFFKFYNELINNKKLILEAKKRGYTIQFMPHPNIITHVDLFDKNENVKFLDINTTYRDVYAESNLVLTDYSSAVFDFAYLKKPIIYVQFDKEEFFAGNHVYVKGYFDYERDGFGEVVNNLEDTVALIISYIKKDCKIKKKYLQRIEQFFAYSDQNNCKRILDKVLELDKRR